MKAVILAGGLGTRLKPFNKKEKIIVVSGRHEDFIKGIDIIFRALKITKLGNWKVFILGSSQPKFIMQFNDFVNNNCFLKENVTTVRLK